MKDDGIQIHWSIIAATVFIVGYWLKKSASTPNTVLRPPETTIGVRG